MIQDVRACVEDGVERLGFSLKIRNQHFDARAWRAPPDFADRLGEDRRAAIRHVIAVDRRHDDVREVEGRDGVRDARRFSRVDGVRASMANRAVSARARADVAEDHERRRPVRPAFADVGAARLLADRMKVQVAHQALEPEIGRRTWRFHLEPLGFGRARRDWRERDYLGHVPVILMDKGVPGNG